MKNILSYNFKDFVNEKTDWEKFYSIRRDANFAAVFETPSGEYIAIRDHLGTCPLYYTLDTAGNYQWSLSFNELMKGSSNLSQEAISHYLGFPSTKLSPLADEISSVPPGTVLLFTRNGVKNLFTYTINSFTSKITKAEALFEIKRLLDQAVERTIKEDHVGLYLSGGMDSGLLGVILKNKGIKIDSYTALPWGKNGTEFHYSQINNDLLNTETRNYIDVKPSDYSLYLSRLKQLYKTPHGTTASLNVAALWENTNISDQKQLFFAQNTDTFTSSVAAQINTVVANLLPKPIRQKIVDMPHDDLIKNYIHHCSHGRVSEHNYVEYINKETNPVSKVALAGMYIGHTPTDSESINAPSIANGQLCSNPYYDMDLIEFYISLPIKFKIALSSKNKTLISFEKRLLREVALMHLPRDLVYRKKGFVLPTERNETAKLFFENLPSAYNGITAKNKFEKLSLKILDVHLS